MLSKKFCLGQIERMGGLTGYPKGQSAAINELVVILTGANNETLATRAIDDVMEVWQECPKPVNLRKTVYELNKHVPATGCALCEFTTWRHYWILWTLEKRLDGSTYTRKERIDDPAIAADLKRKVDKTQRIYSFREPCVCRAGVAPIPEDAPAWVGPAYVAPLGEDYSCGKVCGGWGTVGQPPNVQWCTCAHAEYLQREVPNWLKLCNTGKVNPRIAA
jgi:hypothetical protein